MTLSDGETLALRIVSTVSSSLSVLGCLYIVLSYLLFKDLRSTYSGLVFWLSICDMGAALSWLFLNPSWDPNLCVVQASLMEFFQIASFVWIAAIAISMYIIIVRRGDITYLFPLFHVIAWASAVTAISIAIPLKFFGNANATNHVSWCWIKDELFIPKIYLYYAPFFVIWLICACLYWAVHKEMQRIVISPSLRSRAEQRIALYLLVFLVCLGVGVVNRIQNEVQPKHPILFLCILDALFSPLQGFLNSIVYGLNRVMRRRMINFFFGRCCRTPGGPEDDSEDGERSPIISSGSGSGHH